VEKPAINVAKNRQQVDSKDQLKAYRSATYTQWRV